MPLRQRLLVAVTVASAVAAQARAQSAGQWHGPEDTYEKICRYCHDTGVGPVLKGRGLQPAYIAATVRAGRNGMPAFRPSEISNSELLALGQWLERAASAGKP
jgi:4-cresol dehydrogenase (hydroxylating) cytochrome subunit